MQFITEADAAELVALRDEVEGLRAMNVLHDYEIKSGRECCPCGAAASRYLAERDAAREDLEVADGLAVMYADLRDEALGNAMNVEAALGRVRLLHTPEPEETRPDEEPESRCMECLTIYPCETLRALGGAE